MKKDYITIIKIIIDFIDQLTEEQISELILKKAKLKIEKTGAKKSINNFDIDEITQKLDSFENRLEATEYISSISPNVDLLRQLSKHYSISNYSKLKSQDMIEKIIAATVGTKERHKALYETNLK